MRSQVKPLPQINNRNSVEEEDSYPGRLHTIQRKLKFGSNTYIKSNTSTATETFSLNKKGKQTPVNESQILRQIDSKLELHKKDIEQRNDMIITIEKGFETVKQELHREKQINEEKSKLLLELQTSYHAVQLKLKQFADSQKLIQLSDKEKERIGQLESSIKTYQIKEQEFQIQIESLKGQLGDVNGKLRSKDEVAEDLRKLRDQLQQQKEKQLKYETQVNELNSALTKESNERKSQSNDLNSIKKAYEKHVNDSQSKEQILNKDLNGAQEKIKQLESERNQLLENQKKSKESSDQMNQMSEQISKFKQQLIDLNKSKEVFNSLNQSEIVSLKQKLDIQQKNSIELNASLEEQRQRVIETNKQLKEKCEQAEQYRNQKAQADSQLQVATGEINQLQQQLEQLKQQAGQAKNLKALQENVTLLEKTEKDIQKNLSCTFCGKFIKQPVTVIPCGHSYCFDCKKGYTKECSKCGPKLKVEAMYRNELLDDIIEMVKLIQQSIISLKLVTK